MRNSEFLRKAKVLFKKETAQEMNFVVTPLLLLRVWQGENKVEHKWCTIQTLPEQTDEKLEDGLGKFVANDMEDYPAIIKALRREVKVCPNDIIDLVQFDETDDEKTIDPIQSLEFTLTVKELCDMIGMKED